MLDGLHAGIEEQITAGDAGVDGALAHVDGDVSRAQEEQLDSVGLVEENELASGAAGAVPGLGEHGDGGLGQRPLVGHGDAQHGNP